jgi:hypothetical protein
LTNNLVRNPTIGLNFRQKKKKKKKKKPKKKKKKKKDFHQPVGVWTQDCHTLY